MKADRKWSLWYTVAALALAACGGASAGGPSGEGTQVSESGPDTPLDLGTEPPDTPAGERLAWLLSAMSSPAASASVALEDVFAPEFLAEVPPAQLRAAFAQLSASAPWTVSRITRLDDGRLEAVAADVNDTTLRIRVSVEADPPHRITAYGARLADFLSPNLPASWDAIRAGLYEEGEHVGLLAARLDGDTCVPVYEVDADEPLAIGSAFKLWVLGALADAVADGDAAWDELLAVDPAWRSISDAILREKPDGELLTLREYADAMISVSDNSATDHLILRLGRPRVEAAMTSMGADAAERNTPFATTRAFFAIKGVWNADRRDAYYAASIEERRTMLDEAQATDLGVILWSAISWTSPREIDRVEWFASPRDLCEAMAALRTLSGTDAGAPVSEVLSINPGIGFDESRWTWIGFKGGSEVGVLSGTWMVQRADGAWYVLSLMVNDTHHEVNTTAVMRLAAAGFNLLADE